MSSNSRWDGSYSSYELACWVSEQSYIYGAIIRGLPLKVLVVAYREFIRYTEERWDGWAHRERCMVVQAGSTLHAALNRAIDAARAARGKSPQVQWIAPKCSTKLGAALANRGDYRMPNPLVLWGGGHIPDRRTGPVKPVTVFEDE